MNRNIHIKIERKPTVLSRFGISNSSLHIRINDGLFTPPCSLGARAVGWPEHETSAILKAMVAGQSKEQIKALVTTLVEQRKELMEGLV